MEPENTAPQPNPEEEKKKAAEMRTTVSGLHDEGVDILAPEEVPSAPQIPPVAPKPTPTAPEQPVAPVNRSAQSDIDAILGTAEKQSVAERTAQGPKNDPSIKPLRTFKTDAEEAIRYQNISAAQIAIAEQKKHEESQAVMVMPKQTQEIEVEKKRSAFVPLLLALAIIGAVGGGAYYFWPTIKPLIPPSISSWIPDIASLLPKKDASKPTPVGPNIVVKTLIPHARAEAVRIGEDDDALAAIATRLSSTQVEVGGVFAIVPMPTGTTTTALPISRVLADTRIPNTLARSLGQSYMIGSYVFDLNSPFIILKNTFFQNAYAGMLAWEADMRNDLISLIRVAHPEEATTSADTDTFTDRVIANTDARILRNDQGEMILAYTFADKDTVIIATSESALRHALEKLLAVRVVQ